jgi:uncharacterized protein YbbK (DUF523 family)
VTDAPELVSACLLGVACRYDGQSKAVALGSLRKAVPVCPELLAGLGVPRPAIQRDAAGGVHVVATGVDVTEALADACDQIVVRARQLGVVRAVLKQNSPSCGSSHTWVDGALIPGQGLLTERLRAAGIEVRGEEAA